MFGSPYPAPSGISNLTPLPPAIALLKPHPHAPPKRTSHLRLNHVNELLAVSLGKATSCFNSIRPSVRVHTVTERRLKMAGDYSWSNAATISIFFSTYFQSDLIRLKLWHLIINRLSPKGIVQHTHVIWFESESNRKQWRRLWKRRLFKSCLCFCVVLQSHSNIPSRKHAQYTRSGNIHYMASVQKVCLVPLKAMCTQYSLHIAFESVLAEHLALSFDSEKLRPRAQMTESRQQNLRSTTPSSVNLKHMWTSQYRVHINGWVNLHPHFQILNTLLCRSEWLDDWLCKPCSDSDPVELSHWKQRSRNCW